MHSRFIIRDIKERDNFIDDRIPRTFVRPGVGYFSGLHLMKKYNCSRATAMRGADMPPLFGPFQGQGKYLHVNFDMDTSRLRQAGERARVEEVGEEEETREGLFGGEARELDSEEERQMEIRRLKVGICTNMVYIAKNIYITSRQSLFVHLWVETCRQQVIMSDFCRSLRMREVGEEVRDLLRK